MTQYHKIALTAAFGLAFAFTFSCGEHSWEEDSYSSYSGGNVNNGGNSSSFGGVSSSSSVEKITQRTVKMGDQIWIAKNLDIDVPGSRCYKDDPANCEKYGRLYSWATAMALPSKCNSNSASDAACAIKTPHQGICPAGWHIPNNADWDALYRFVDGSSGKSSPYMSEWAGKYLKAEESGWQGEDSYGFTALPGGFGGPNPIKDYGSGSWWWVGTDGYWWTSSEYNSNYAYYRSLVDSEGSAFYCPAIAAMLDRYLTKENLVSVRCVGD